MVGNDIGIGPDVGIPKIRFVTEPLNDSERVRSEIVLRDSIARIGPGENDLTDAGSATTATATTATGTSAGSASASRRWAGGLLLRNRPDRAERNCRNTKEQTILDH
jgi:hypothetical protein